MPQVPPGDATGLYYILVSSLPWNCTWQRLKDFARNQDNEGKCTAVEHTKVYKESTCGWITVRGKEDFLKALAHLQGGMLDGRALCADGRNETEWIEVRDLAAPWSPQRYQEWISAGRNMPQPIPSIPPVGPFTTTPSQNMYHQPSRMNTTTSNISPTYTNEIGVPQYRPTQSIEIPYSSSLAPALAAMSLSPHVPLLELQSVPSSPSSLSESSFTLHFNPNPAAFTLQPPVAYNMLLPPVIESQYAAQPSYDSPAETMSSVRSKVIVTSIPQKASSRELSAFIRSTIKSSSLGHEATEVPFRALESIEIERHPDGTQKSHAFLIFETYEMAQSIVNMLDGVKFHGRALKFKLAKEGTASGMGIGTGTRLRPITKSSYVGGSAQGYQHSRQQSSTFARSSRSVSRDGSETIDDAHMTRTREGSLSMHPGDTRMFGMSNASSASTYPVANSRASYGAFTSDKKVDDKTTTSSGVIPSSSAAVAAAAKMRETSPDSPLVVDGSSPWHGN